MPLNILFEMSKFLITLLLSVLSTMRVFGQEDIRFFHLTSADGLSKNSVIKILQDSRGYMWFGTRDGLNKYDGYQFSVYREDKFDNSSICSNIATDINEDADGNLWIASPKGVSMFNRNQEIFVNFTNSSSNTSSFDFNDLRKTYIDRQNRVFIAGKGGLALYNKESKRFNRVFDKDIHSVLIDSQEMLWLGTRENGIFLLDGNTFEVKKHYSKNPSNKISISDNFVTVIKESKDGTYWIGYNNSGIDHFTPSTGTIHHYVHDPKNPETLCNNVIRVIADGPNDELWIGTYKGISRLSNIDGQVKFKTILHKANEKYSLSHNSVYDVFKDERGAIWVATYFGGLSVFDEDSQLFDYYKPELNNKNSLSYHVVGQFIEASEDKVWIATEGGGLDLFDRNKKSFKHFSNDPKNPNSLPDDNIKAICQEDDGNLWLGMFMEGLVHFNPVTKRTKIYNTTNSSLEKNSVQSLLLDHKGTLWIGTANKLYQYDQQTDDFVTFQFPDSKSEITELSKIKFMLESSNKNIWIGTLGKGLFLLNRKTNSIENYLLDEDSTNTSNHNLINYLFEGSDQNIWIGTLGGGLLKFNPISKSFKVYYTNDGLVNNIVFCIVEDDQGLLWVSTSNGLSRFNPKTEVFKNYGVNDLPIYEFNEGSCYKSKDGTIFMGGIDGFITFKPENIKDTNFDAPIVLTSLKIGNDLIKPSKGSAILQKSINEQESIALNYENRNISIGYASLNYVLSGENQYAYFLEGFDSDWNYVGAKREATYTNLTPGSYTLKIKTYRAENKLNDLEKSIDISVSPPLWKSWWAYMIYLFVILGALYLLTVTLEYKVNIEKNLELEHLERVKSEELNNFKLKFYTNISHEFRTPLTLILSPLERLISSKAGDSYLRKQHQLIYKNAMRLQVLINELMDFRKIETNNLHMKVAEGNIAKFIKEIKISFDEYAKERGISYSINQHSEHFPLYYDRDQLEKVFFNLLSNAFKFTERGGSISIDIQKDEINNKVNIVVSDTGKGMTAEQTKHIFDRFFQVDPSSQKQASSGIGLSLTSEIVKLHNGTITVSSTLNEGTSFTVTLPMGSKHFKPEEIIEDFKDSEHMSPYLNESALINLKESEEESEQLTSIEDLPDTMPLILIADDNHEIRNYLVAIFKNEYKIVQAADGEQALNLAEQHFPDLIISDVMMPNMNGIDLCAKLKRGLTTSHIPIILLTARTSLIYQANGLETGADDYITKPFNDKLLLLKVSNLIKTRENLRKYFLGEVNIEPQKITVTPVDEKFIRKAIELIEENLANANFDVNMFVDKMNVSRSALFVKLKNLTGQTPNDFIRTIRLKRAAQILQQDKLTNSEICYMVGFSTPRHFRKCFLELFGKTPIQYAKDYHSVK